MTNELLTACRLARNLVVLSIVFVVPSRPALAAMSFDERLECQRAIEEVYWRHRIWPTENPGLKPALSQILPQERLRAMVEDDLRASNALEAYWQRPLTAAQLQAELQRMAKQTRSPELLEELWSALDLDPERLAECLARPLLAQRLARSWFAGDARFNGSEQQSPKEERKEERPAGEPGAPSFAAWLAEIPATPLPDVGLAAGFDYTLPKVGGGCADDRWTPVAYRPEKRAGHTALWTGAEMIVWSPQNGHVYDPATDRWRPMNRQDAPEDGWETAVWTGSEMIVWGGRILLDDPVGGGARYDPVSDTWQRVADLAAPEPRSNHTAVWTGSEMIIWGGFSVLPTVLDTGARYRPDTDTWQPVSTAGAPAPRLSHRAVWTGGEMIVWSGISAGNVFADGGRYDPGTDSWQPMSTAGAPAARTRESAAWTGAEMVIWGGCLDGSCFTATNTNTGGRYDPLTDTWFATSLNGAPVGRRAHSAAWTGDEMIVWGGCNNEDCSQHTASGGRYDPVTDSWAATSMTNAPALRSLHSAVWTGTEMLVWGGCNTGECQIKLRDGGRYDPATDSWVTVDTTHPSERFLHSAVWTGAEMIVWGGTDGFEQRSGGRYSPALDAWLPMSNSPGGIDARDKHSAVWTGTEMIIWGGSAFGIGTVQAGGRYDPVNDLWTPTSVVGAPERRHSHQAAWTGSTMLVWGGCSFGTCNQMRDSGGLYDPATDSWQPTSLIDAPTGRAWPSGVWTGSQLLVWGGWDGSSPVADGGRYTPALDTWTPLGTVGAPAARHSAPAVWSGTEMILWGGSDDSQVFSSGGRYDLATDSWQGTSEVGAPLARYLHVAEWSGSEMLVSGGCEAPNFCWDRDPLGDGARYDPATDSWSPALSRLFAPPARQLASSVWTGSEMIVWGGKKDNELDDGSSYCAPGLPALILADDFESGDLSSWSDVVP